MRRRLVDRNEKDDERIVEADWSEMERDGERWQSIRRPSVNSGLDDGS